MVTGPVNIETSGTGPLTWNRTAPVTALAAKKSQLLQYHIDIMPIMICVGETGEEAN